MAAVGRDGSIFARARKSTPKHVSPNEFLAVLGDLADECRGSIGPDKKIVGIAVAVPATFNAAEGILTKLPNLPSLNGMNLKAGLADKFSLPVTVENDATAAAIGENWRGASRGISTSILVTLGTGVGGGIIINNKPLRGLDGTAGEIGHICVEPLGHPCGCGSRGCVEQYASATAIVRMAGELRAGITRPEPADLEWQTALQIYEAGMGGSELAVSVFERMGFYLGVALADLVNVLNPEMIVIGGGVSAGWELFADHVSSEVRKRAFREPAERAKMIRAELGDDAGILGAARTAFGE